MENLFEKARYKHIFPNSDPEYYLTRYWLMRAVTNGAHGYPERGYAKWLVLGFIWSRLSPLIRTTATKNAFISSMELGKREIALPLSRVVDKVFVAALNYWRMNRGKGAKRVDVSTFFRNKRGRHDEFKSFWQGGRNHSRRGFANAWKRVAKTIQQTDRA